MAVGSYTVNVSIAGVTFNKTINRTADHPNAYEPSIPAAASGTIVARTNNTKTNVNATAHGLSNGKMDCFFSTGVAYGCDGVAEDANTISLNNANGDVFPANTTACQVAQATQVNTAIDGDASVLLAICLEDPDASSTKVGHVQFLDAGDNEIAEIDLVANAPRVWDITGGDTNDFTGNAITYAYVAHNDTSARTVKIASLDDSTP